MARRIICTLIGVALAAGSTQALAQSDAPADSGKKATNLGSVEVTGSAIPRTSKETPSPVTVIDALQIKRSGLTTVADVVRSISADNSGTIPTAFTAGFAAGSSGVALRGLTVNSTLVLIDGRRVASYALADDGQRSFVDLNTIPLDAVDRIEVLKDGASSLYGADAIAGVVNVILKRNFSGVDATAEIGNSQRGGGLEKRVTASWGRGSLDNDRFNAYAALEYESDGRIAASQRDFPFNTFDLSSIGGFNGNGGQPANFSGSIVGSVTPGQLGTPGDLTSGIANDGALSQPLRACVPGTNLVNDPNNDLGGGAGSYCTQNFVNYFDDQSAQERLGLYGRVTFKIGDYSEAYLNASYYQNKVTVNGGPPGIQASTPNNTDAIALPIFLPDGSLNPNNPFAAQGQYALINYAFGDIQGGSETFNHVMRVVGGVKGTWGEWNYDSAVVYNHTRLQSVLDGFINFNQLMKDVTDGTYNFIDPSKNSDAVRAALAQNLAKNSTSDLDSIDLRVNRPLMRLGGGDLGLALGAEWRHEAQNDPDLNPGNQYQGLGIAHTIGSRNVGALYTEIDAPLTKELEVDASARFDHYSDFGKAFDPKVGFKWKPIDELAFRGTFSRGFRAPAFAENGSSAAEGFTTYQIPTDSVLFQQHEDAQHNPDNYVSAPYALAQATTANPNIQPEHSKSLTFGMIVQPTSWLNASIDWYSIKKTGVIVQSDPSVPLNQYLAGECATPAACGITVDIPDPLHPGALPRPIAVSAPYVNANSLKTNGLDLDLRAKFHPTDNTQFISELNFTEIFDWTMRFPDGSVQRYVGTQGPYILSSGAGTPRYRANWANTLIWGKLETTATIYYTSGLRMSVPDLTGDNSCFSTDPNGNNFPPSCRMPSFTDVDLTGIYHINDHVDVSGAIENLFDRKPPFDPIDYAGINYNPTFAQSGIIGRFFKLGFHVRF
jgi:iron complex outermembrane receptor protein